MVSERLVEQSLKGLKEDFYDHTTIADVLEETELERVLIGCQIAVMLQNFHRSVAGLEPEQYRFSTNLEDDQVQDWLLGQAVQAELNRKKSVSALIGAQNA